MTVKFTTRVIIMIFNIFRFKTNCAKEVIQETLLKYLKDKEFCEIQCDSLSKTIAAEVKDTLKGNNITIIFSHYN